VRLALPIGGVTGGSGNLFTSLSNIAKQAAHPKFVWVSNANCDWTIIYNDPVEAVLRTINIKTVVRFANSVDSVILLLTEYK
jgi:dTDP-4-dehydrorhamnose reductase